MNQPIVKEGHASALPTPSTHTKPFPNAIRTTQELDKISRSRSHATQRNAAKQPAPLGLSIILPHPPFRDGCERNHREKPPHFNLRPRHKKPPMSQQWRIRKLDRIEKQSHRNRSRSQQQRPRSTGALDDGLAEKIDKQTASMMGIRNRVRDYRISGAMPSPPRNRNWAAAAAAGRHAHMGGWAAGTNIPA